MSHVKILFKLEQDEDGYPPVSYESVWATQRGEYYQLDNIPFFTHEATYEDIVEATTIDDELWFTRVINYSHNSLLRAIYFSSSDPASIRSELEQRGCSTELMGRAPIISINIPPGVKVDPILEYLNREAEQERLTYEEALIWY